MDERAQQGNTMGELETWLEEDDKLGAYISGSHFDRVLAKVRETDTRIAKLEAKNERLRSALQAMIGTYEQEEAYMVAHGLDTSDETALSTPNACG